ncbi:uncharacterized protein [Epargyreus clarus]|uniref:uncharacterized protein n=1 Tax=Epargyreus clarus TaxID=520877 RepID=UPI003C2F33C2
MEYNEEVDQELLDITDSQAEIVPFKVLEELSRIKAFLTKRDRRQNADGVSDSGYKSDSQTRNFKSALQSSNIWLNQSAHSLLSYLAQCPLLTKTADITNEISKTLGQLIDRLHEEEKYPSFLEEHLEKVEELLKDIYENDTSENILLKKDEHILRLFLLNKSSHIIKYTIEKITAILEIAHTKLTGDEIFEIDSIHEIENLSYIFHVLEVLLKRILIFKNISSQNSTQSSQDEGILKKSSLTDIWRKKWNAKNSKFESDANVGYKKCVIDQCGVILNKIIVQTMDGYSLISFYALQCFNLLQN